jgi:uncharacterized protein
MRWEGRRKSARVDDRRGGGTGKKVAIGGGLVAVLLIIMQLLGGGENAELIQTIASQLEQPQTREAAQPLSEEDQKMGDFAATLLADTEDVWHELFRQQGLTYREPQLVLFRGSVQSACGGASSSSGPFYCPADESVYMDLDFFEILRTRFGAKGGDFAIAYVLAHEVGHHVQHQLGVLKKVHEKRRQLPEKEGNRVHVAMELQADFYAGVWAHHVRKYLEAGDMEEALSAAASVGNDAIQKRTQGFVVEESFTHGSSEQRMYWLNRGYETGDIREGDTFAALLK